MGRLQTDRAFRAALLATALLALLLRLPTLGLRRIVEGDGVHYAWLARLLLAGDPSGIANPYWSNLWPAVIAATAVATGQDAEAAGRAASLLASVLAVVSSGLLAARLFGRSAGLLAALALATHPWLMHFSTLVYSESFFAALLVALLLAGERVVEEPGPVRAGLVGLTGGAALLTRPEAWAAIAATLGMLVLRGGRARLAAAGLIAACLAAALGLRAGLVHRYHGVWDFGLGSKGAVNLLVGLADSDGDRARLVGEVGPDGGSRLVQRARETSLWRIALQRPAALAQHAARNLRGFAGAAWRVWPPMPAAPGHGRPGAAAAACLAVAVAGAVFGLRGVRSRPGTLLLVSTFAIYAAGLAPLLVHDRLVVALAAPFLVLLAGGVVELARRWPARRRILLAATAAALIVLGAASLLALLRAPQLAYAGDPPVQRNAARWLAHHVEGPVRLMSASRGIAYYLLDTAHWSDDVYLPWGELSQVVAVARAHGVDVIAAAEWHLVSAEHPAARELLRPAASGGLEHLVTLGQPGRRIFLYRVSERDPGEP